MTRSPYRCFQIPASRWSHRVGDVWIWVEVLAHLLCVSVPWIHPRLRRRVHRKGRR